MKPFPACALHQRFQRLRMRLPDLSFMGNHKNQPAHRRGSQRNASFRRKVMFFRKLTNGRSIIVVFRSCYIMLPPILQEVSEKNSLIQRIAVLQGERFAEIFMRYERGETLKVIADSLNKRGFRTRGAEINRIAALQDKEETTLPALREQLKECEKSIKNMLNAIQMSILTASAKTRLKEPEARQNELKLSIMQAELQKPKYTKEQIVSCINRFKYGDEDDIDYQKQIIDTFINAICVFDDKLVFTYNFKDGTEAIPLKAVEDAFGSNLTQAAPPNWVKAISLDLFSCVSRIAAPSKKVKKGYVPQIRRHTVRKTIKPAEVHFEKEWTQIADKKPFSPAGGRIALSANERIAEFLSFAIRAKFAYTNKLTQDSIRIWSSFLQGGSRLT